MDLSEYAAIVVTLGAYRAFRLSSLGGWRRDIARMLQELKTNAAADVTIVLTGVPRLRSTPAANDIADAIANTHARAMDKVTEALCSQMDGAAFLPLPAHPSDPYVADWHASEYAYLGGVIADRLAVELGKKRRASLRRARKESAAAADNTGSERERISHR